MTQPTRRELAKVIISLLDKGLTVKKVGRQTAAYLLSQNRTAELAPLMRDILDLRAQAGTVEATATSVHALSGAVKKELERLVAANHTGFKKVILEEERDASLVGGVKLTAGEMQLDLTVHGRLKHLTGLQPERT